MKPLAFVRWWPLLLLSALTLLAYFPAFQLNFIRWDDPDYVTRDVMVQKGLTAESIAWALTTFSAANYHPLTWLSLMLDVELFGQNPLGFHAVNLLLHLGNVLLTFLVFRQLTSSQLTAGVVAGILAIHPQHAESVAWVAERKDVLSIFFGLWAMLLYVNVTEPKTWRRMLIISGLHGLSLLSKPTLVTLPCLLLLLDYWPLERWKPTSGTTSENLLGHMPAWRVWTRLCWEKWPLFLLSLTLSFIVIQAQRSGEAISNLQDLAVPFRLGNAIVSYVEYLQHATWPLDLCAFYPHPQYELNLASVGVGVLLIMAISAGAIKLRQRLPCLLIGWLWYLGTLVPMIGLIQVGIQAMADRYMYFPMLGISFAMAGCLTEWVGKRPSARKVVGVLATLVVLVCVPLTWRQISYWSSGEKLWQRAVEVTRNNVIAHYNLASELYDQGNLEQAETHELTALRLRPKFADALYNMSRIRDSQDRMDEAIVLLAQAVSLKPSNVRWRALLGHLLTHAERFDEAITELHTALSIDPSLAEGHFHLGVVHHLRGRTQEARKCYETTLRLAPDYSQAKINLERLK